jgi:hypothetical protein
MSTDNDRSAFGVVNIADDNSNYGDDCHGQIFSAFQGVDLSSRASIPVVGQARMHFVDYSRAESYRSFMINKLKWHRVDGIIENFLLDQRYLKFHYKEDESKGRIEITALPPTTSELFSDIPFKARNAERARTAGRDLQY